jgi:crotonobetainyl-CoA:carnitine CoA-transferase CaiB-like acyl-CoA transferase
MSSLNGIRVLDLSRVFSGPWATQMLADFGAEVIKVERPMKGDDVRYQGVPLKTPNGDATQETSSFIAMNRGKKSITVDISCPKGQEIIKDLVQKSDILVENFKPKDLERFGLDYSSLKLINPRLIYCSISGFGQSGPYSHRPGYDPIFQAMSGLMSVTGKSDGEPGGGPVRTGFAIGDVTAGFYAVCAILAALRHRDVVSNQGQHIDLALYDAQVSSLSHLGMMYLVTGQQPQRLGNASPITCPYQSFECSDGTIMVTVGNDSQFVKFCKVLGLDDLSQDQRFTTNQLRVKNKHLLIPLIEEVIKSKTVDFWYQAFELVGVPSGPIQEFSDVFNDPQIKHRNIQFEMEHPILGAIPQIANPVVFSETPNVYELPPPSLGQHTVSVLKELLNYDQAQIGELFQQKII